MVSSVKTVFPSSFYKKRRLGMLAIAFIKPLRCRVKNMQLSLTTNPIAIVSPLCPLVDDRGVRRATALNAFPKIGVYEKRNCTKVTLT